MNTYIAQHNNDFIKIFDFFKKELSNLRTGRANAAILDNVQVQSYGALSAVTSLASVTIQDARSMLVSPWDKNTIKDIEKAIIEAHLGVGVVNEGDKLRITIPQTTEENRKELVKTLNEKYEHARIEIRKVRDEIKNEIEDSEKAKEISEDDKFRYLRELEEAIHKQSEEAKKIRDKKEVDIMSI
ncbi:MAG: ribosome recycling factor [Candidatus Falkowbacteria bacterium]|nr:ribosome recycling factor [Candidatus Falkowbacteria bacterium]